MRIVAAFAAGLFLCTSAQAADRCAVLAGRVDAIPGNGPVFLQSYDGTGVPALETAAFTYDNSLAAIALVACRRIPQARRIGEALLLAATQDRAGPKGRLRNAYRAGPQTQLPPPPNGWWDHGAGRWVEDAYQVGSATGNVAWAGLALLAMGDKRMRAAAGTLADWIVGHTRDPQGGFSGGIHGGEGSEVPLTWKSTEHNVDVAALMAGLGRRKEAAEARSFVAAMFDGSHFWTGTLPDGRSINRATSGLDAQLWPMMLPNTPVEWRRALDYAERTHGAEGGFDFNDDRDGMWVEGTAQAALAYGLTGRPGRARDLLELVGSEHSPGGLLFATRRPRITTGLAIGPDSTTDDFHYYRWPHLGATAWAVLAEKGVNPFR